MNKNILIFLVIIFFTIASNSIALSVSLDQERSYRRELSYQAKKQSCTDDSDCNDNNACTDDECKGRKCRFTYNTNPCDDGLFCTVNDTCNSGVCVGSGNPCTSNCDEVQDVCIDPTTTSTSANPSTTTTIIGSSTTTILNTTTTTINPDPSTTTIPFDYKECTSDEDCNDNNGCTTDICVAKACENTPLINGTVCDDGNYCTQIDVCKDGICTGSSDPCLDNEDYCDGVEICEEDLNNYICNSTGNPCELLTCDEFNDVCEGSAVTLSVTNTYGYSGIIEILLENEFDYISEIHFDVCNIDQYPWLQLDTVGCSTSNRSNEFSCEVSDFGDGCMRVDLTTISGLIEPGIHSIAQLNYSIVINAPLDDLADIILQNVNIKNDTSTSLPATLKAGKVGISSTESSSTTSIPSTTTITIGKELCAVEAVYGENSVEVEFLRKARDTVLIKTPKGREIIKLYYELSPIITTIMKEDEKFKEEIKELIGGMMQLIMDEVD